VYEYGVSVASFHLHPMTEMSMKLVPAIVSFLYNYWSVVIVRKR